jgi:hypothetical protein
MHTTVESSKGATVTTGKREGKTSLRCTTLYEIIVALQDLVGPQDDALVVATVVHLLQSQRLTMLRTAKTPL